MTFLYSALKKPLPGVVDQLDLLAWNLPYFTEQFKRRWGVTPSMMKKAARQPEKKTN